MLTKVLLTVLVVLITAVTSQYTVATDCQPTDGECHSLPFYVAHSSSYFTNNTIFYFKEGVHTLMKNIFLIGVQNVSFIGLNHHVIINSTLHYSPRALIIESCTNISIVNITTLCHKCNSLYDWVTSIYYSHGIALYNVNTSIKVFNSFKIAINNSYISYFYGTFNPSVHCYSNLQSHDLTFINSNFSFLGLIMQYATSYILNVTLDNISFIKLDSQIPYPIYIVASQNSFNNVIINNVFCYGDLLVQFVQAANDKSNCKYDPNINMPASNHLVISSSYIGGKFQISNVYNQLNSFKIAINNSYISYFYGTFNPSVHCYSNLQSHDLTFINSNFSYFGLIMQHATSYILNVTLDNISFIKLDSQIKYPIYIVASQNSLNNVIINNVFCYGDLLVQFVQLAANNTSNCKYHHMPAASNHLVIRSSYIGGRFQIFFLSNITYNQLITINSCVMYNGFYIENEYDRPLIMVLIVVVNTQLLHGLHAISNMQVNNIIFSNVFIGYNGVTGLSLINSKLAVSGDITVSNNKALNGGGMALYGNSQLKIYPNSILKFIGNHAANKGGGIYRSDPRAYRTDCSIFIPNTSNVSIYFINNKANIGDDIYGIELKDSYCPINMSVFKTGIKYATPPMYVCYCPKFCTTFMSELNVFPGQKIIFNISLWDASSKITGGSIIRYLNNTYIDTIHIEQPKCTEISYTATVSSNSSRVNYVSTLNMYLSSYSFTLRAQFSVLPCPIGFAMSPIHGICTCSSSIFNHNVTCDIDTLQISHKSQLWIGPYNTSISFNASQPNHYNICLINEQCLLCNPSNVSFMLNDTDPQCQQYKSGTLCGSCTTGYSLVLGSNECMKCTTNYNMALIILFAFMGIALVVFLIALNLTVSVGTINGLLFTGNIIKLYQPVFLGNHISIPVFSQVVSWLNLDFGIAICFYNGMDNYSKQWLQFAFPFYIWTIIIVIILICRVSSKVSKLVGSNAVPVLATLLLLSYVKLLHTIVTILHKRNITLHCENSSHQLTVWYEDPTLQYAKGKHLYLFAFALIVLVLFCLPYTLFVLLNPLFEKYLTKYRLCSFWYKFKPVLDAYNGLMKDEYRFWNGVLLVARIPVLLAVTFAENLIQFRYLLLSVLLSVLVVILTCFRGVYNNPLHNIIETWFIFMLTVMAVLAIASDSVRYTIIWYNVSIGVFTCSFIAIIVYHLYLKLARKFPHTLSTLKVKLELLRKFTSKDQPRLIRSSSYEIFRHDSITDLYEPVNINDYKSPVVRDGTVPTVPMTVPDIIID